MYEYHNKVVLITGAASGFGKLLAEKLSSVGAKLVLGDLNEAGVKAVAEQLQTDIVAQACDVTQESQVKDLVSASIETFCCPSNSYMNGQAIAIDGGFSAN